MESTDRFEALLRAARNMSAAEDTDAFLSDLLDNARQVVAAEAGSIFLPDAKTGDLVLFQAAGDNSGDLKTIRVPKGSGIVGAAYESRASINIPDVHQDPRFFRKAATDAGFNPKAMLTVPLLDGAHCLGVMQVLNSAAGPTFSATDQTLMEGFASLAAATFIRLQNQKTTLYEARSKQEMALAREIQESYLPPPEKILPACRLRMGYFPAKEVGGDFYFVHALDNHRVLCGLGDVSGKGIPAALTMGRITAEIHVLARELLAAKESDLPAWVSLLNTRMCAELKQGRFVGTTFLLADSRAGQMHICTAGQNPPLLGDRTTWTPVEAPAQPPLGIISGYEYEGVDLPLQSNQHWLLYSDGINEARNPLGDEWGYDAVRAALPVGAAHGGVFDALVQSWQKFRDGAQPHDDASLVLLDWRGPPPSPTYQVECQPANLCYCRKHVERWAEYCGYDDITTGQIILAVDEATTNVYRHAYDGEPGPLEYQFTIDEDHLCIVLIDQGKPVDVTRIKGRALDDLRPGGLGTVLLGRVFDEVRYEPQATGTRLILRKKLP